MLVKQKVPYPRLRPITMEFMKRVQRLSEVRQKLILTNKPVMHFFEKQYRDIVKRGKNNK
jgi:hypothetical protein